MVGATALGIYHPGAHGLAQAALSLQIHRTKVDHSSCLGECSSVVSHADNGIVAIVVGNLLSFGIDGIDLVVLLLVAFRDDVAIDIDDVALAVPPIGTETLQAVTEIRHRNRLHRDVVEADAAREDEPLVELPSTLGRDVALVAIVLEARRSALDGLSIFTALTGTFHLDVAELTVREVHLARFAIEEVAHAAFEVEVVEVAGRDVARSGRIEEEERNGLSQGVNPAAVAHIGVAEMAFVAASQQHTRALDVLEVESVKLPVGTAVEPQGSPRHPAIGALGDALAVLRHESRADHRLGACQEGQVAQPAASHEDRLVLFEPTQAEEVRLRRAVG